MAAPHPAQPEPTFKLLADDDIDACSFDGCTDRAHRLGKEVLLAREALRLLTSGAFRSKAHGWMAPAGEKGYEVLSVTRPDLAAYLQAVLEPASGVVASRGNR